MVFMYDCIRFSWVYLLSHKSKVKTLIQNFYNIDFTAVLYQSQGILCENAKDFFNLNLSIFSHLIESSMKHPTYILHNKMKL